jgi:hypothetical protein
MSSLILLQFVYEKKFLQNYKTSLSDFWADPLFFGCGVVFEGFQPI